MKAEDNRLEQPDLEKKSKDLSPQEILVIDQKHCWHPYSSFENQSPLYVVEQAEGVKLKLACGTEVLDGMASWWSVIHGYNHPELNKAVTGQMEKFAHVMFGGFTHEPASRLIKKLVDLTPEPLTKVFLSDSGSVAVEVAIKMALQYWQSKGKSNKVKMATVRRGYHGDTFACMSVCDPVTGMHHIFNKVLFQQHFIPEPPAGYGRQLTEHDLAPIKSLFAEYHQEIAAFIIEPIVQGTGGMRFYSLEYLRAVRELCDQHDVLLIHDEIATGFGRTGEFFACHHADISPDIMTVGKAMTGGYMTLAATLCTDQVASGICKGEAGVFMHGPTYMANPLACAVANKSIDLLIESDWKSNIKRIEAQLSQGLLPINTLPAVEDVRVLGAIGVVEMKQPVDLNEIQPRLVAEGIWLRPFGKLIYTMPPYITTDDELAFLCEKTAKVIRELHG